jgi:hypothetical protein
MRLSHQAVYTWEAGLMRPRPYNGRQLEAILQTPLDVLLAPEEQKEAGTEVPTSENRQVQYE